MPGLGWGRAGRSVGGVLLAVGVALAACDVDTMPPPVNNGVLEDGGSSRPGVVTGEPEPIIGINTEVFRAAPIITPPARVVPTRCGDGELDPGERCDPGKDVCCAEDCSGPKKRGAVCRDAVGPCDLPDVCDGEGLACPDDALREQGVVCRAAEGDCDAPETCDGETRQCPEDIFQPPTQMCRAAREICDEAEFCTGESNECPGDGVASAEKECRPQAEGKLCDAPEHCDGQQKACPPDVLHPAKFVCRVSEGSCDSFAECDGESAECPPLMDGIAPAGSVCHQADGPCDAEEKCDGVTAICPDDRLVPASENKVCRAKMGECDRAAEVCTGESAECPADTLEPAGFVCRAARGACDVEEKCSGSAAECPPDVFAGIERVCKPSAGVCDIADSCNGTSRDCPTDRFDVGKPCNPSRGVCDVAEVCGNAPNCPADAFAVDTTCREANENEICDEAEVCGNAAACPPDIGVAARVGRVCRPASATSAPCDADAVCGGSPECPATNPVAPRGSIECRAANGICDVAESCDGVSRQCPSDGFAGGERMCRGSNGDSCDAPEFCNSMGRNCPADIGVTDGHVCRAANTTASLCDVDAKCNGSPNCPANPAAAMGTMCRPMNGVCDIAETCDGTSRECPDEDFAGNERTCRNASGDPCDVAEVCSNTSRDCPPDRGVTDATRVCRPKGDTTDLCDLDATCDGQSPTCPATNPVAGEGTECRAKMGDCDVAEICNGTSRTCPRDGFDTGRECRPKDARLPCDVAESCGNAADCPEDKGLTGTVCRDANATRTLCDADALCDGTPICPPLRPASKDTLCRSDTGVCDVPDYCTGSSTTCPADDFEKDGTACMEVQGERGQCSMGVCCPGVTKDSGRGCEIAGATLVFVTSKVFVGDLDRTDLEPDRLGIDGADATCNELARAANLAGTYAAWLSVLSPAGAPVVNARDRVGQQGPYVRVDGVVIRESLEGLSDVNPIKQPINIDEWGIERKGSPVWTGTGPTGNASGSSCSSWTTQDGNGIWGNADEVLRGQWTFANNNGVACKTTPGLRLYCFQTDAVATTSRGN